MTTPNILTPVYRWNSNYDYRLRDDSNSGYIVYDLYMPNATPPNWSSGATNFQHSIKVVTDPTASDFDTWLDNAATFPTTPVVNGIYIELYDDNSTLIYKFIKPTATTTPPASWISTDDDDEDDTVNEEILVPSGSITKDASGALYFRVNKSSPLTSSVNIYGIYKDYNFLRSINHSSSAVDAVGYENNAADGLWQLWHDDGGNLQLLADYTVVSSEKVFSNFW